MQAMGADQREKGREEPAAVRTRADLHHAVKFADFHGNESQPEHERNEQPRQHRGSFAGFHRQRGKAEGDAAEQQQQGFAESTRQAEQVCPVGPPAVPETITT